MGEFAELYQGFTGTGYWYIGLPDLGKIPLSRTYTGGAVPLPRPAKGALNSELSHFSNLKLNSEEHKKISLLFIQCTKKIVCVDQSLHDRSPNEKSI